MEVSSVFFLNYRRSMAGRSRVGGLCSVFGDTNLLFAGLGVISVSLVVDLYMAR